MSRPRVDPVQPAPGQESVWDYPRPPLVEPSAEHVVVVLGGATILDTTRAVRVLETSHPPVYYLPRDEFSPGSLTPTAGQSFCEYKGAASYLTVHGGAEIAERAAWFYAEPSRGFEQLRGLVAVYPEAMDGCFVDGERVTPQEGGFYGGWVTSRIVGPFKGAPGTSGW